ncbi:transcriptional regulator [Herbaspirillum sp. HC18]|nr:transcriptional regulator [Herbaspirillum sp. HC18]
MKIERFLSQEDAAVLSRLAENLLRMREVSINFAEQLIELISSSILLPQNAQRHDYVSLRSEVTFREVGSTRSETVFLVCPQDAHEGLARVSILAPLALALIGRPLGSVTEVVLPFNRVKYVEITGVRQPGDREREGTRAAAGSQVI